MNLLLKYMSCHLKIRMQYKVSFIFSLITQLLTVLVEIFIIKSVFDKFNLLDRYNTYELYLNFSIIWFSYSLAEFIGRGFDRFTNLMVDGSFDLLLIRPRNIFIQIIGSEFFYEKLSRVLSMLILFIYSSSKLLTSFDIVKIFMLISMLLGSTIIILSLFILGATICFFTIQGIEVINIFTNGSKHVMQYPLGIYNKLVKVVFTVIIPLALTNYYPIEYIVGRSNNILFIFLPIISSLFIIPSIFIFKLGLKKYKSSGS